MYQPQLARFLSRDPILTSSVDVLYPVPNMAAMGSSESTPHSYDYVRNWPTMFVDPSGLQPECGTEQGRAEWPCEKRYPAPNLPKDVSPKKFTDAVDKCKKQKDFLKCMKAELGPGKVLKKELIEWAAHLLCCSAQPENNRDPCQCGISGPKAGKGPCIVPTDPAVTDPVGKLGDKCGDCCDYLKCLADFKDAVNALSGGSLSGPFAAVIKTYVSHLQCLKKCT